MIINEVNFIINDGRQAVLRNPTISDASALLGVYILSSKETPYLQRYPEEYDEISSEKVCSFIQKMNDSDRNVLFVCILDNHIVGYCQMFCEERLKTRHRANLSIVVLKKYWDLGIGTKMFQTMIRIADEDKEIIQLELDFIEGNTRAYHLYKKLGFERIAVIPNAIKLRNGNLLNEYIMIKRQ